MSNLYERFKKLRDKHDSIIVLGLDPKTDEHKKVLELAKINQGIIGFKPNLAFYHDRNIASLGYNGRELLGRVSDNIEPGMIKLLDGKFSDGANTNSAPMESYKEEFDTITIAPASSCIEETIDVAKKNEYNVVSMGAMSFPGILKKMRTGIHLCIEEVQRSIDAGTDAFVLGATSFVPQYAIATVAKCYKKKYTVAMKGMDVQDIENAIHFRNHLFEYIVTQMKRNLHLLALVPGFGRQGGNLEYFLASGIDLNRCMINAGSDVLKAEDPLGEIFIMQKVFNQARRLN